MARACNDCVNDEKYCGTCTRNPSNPFYTNHYMAYIPTCRFNYMDCIHDPAYTFHYDKEWYHELYGDMTPEEAANDKEGCRLCKHGEHYDDEDK